MTENSELDTHYSKKKRRISKKIKRDTLNALLFLAPALIALFLFRLLPAGYAIKRSFEINGSFVGFENYKFLLTMPQFINSVKVTIIFNAIINPMQIFIALILAILLVQKVKAANVWRIIIFMPVAVPITISSIVWGIAFRPEDGLVNAILAVFNIPKQPWLTSPDQALFSIMILATWVGAGYWMIFLIAGLKDIPDVYYDAAKVDGAGWWKTLFRITLPMLRRPLAFVLVADTVANFLLFPPVQILTRGGPNESTNLVIHDIYRQAYTFGDMSIAYSEVVLLMLVMTLIVILEFRLLRSEV